MGERLRRELRRGRPGAVSERIAPRQVADDPWLIRRGRRESDGNERQVLSGFGYSAGACA